MPRGQAVVFFLRNPVTRFASGFASRQRRGQPRYDETNTEAELTAFSQFATPNDLASALSSTEAATREQAQHAMHGINHVRIRYAAWFHERDYFLSRQADIFFVGFQESLTNDFAALRVKLGLDDDVALPHDRVLAHRRPADQPHALSHQAIANLCEWYAEDIAFFELCGSMSAEINRRAWPANVQSHH